MTRVTVRRSDVHNLPSVCCVCGQTATRTRPERFGWTPPWVSWLILLAGLPWVLSDVIPRPSYAHSGFAVACVLPWVLSVVFARRSAALSLPVCDRHERRSRRAWVVLGVGLTAAVATAVAANSAVPDPALRAQVTTGAVGLGGLSLLVALFGRDDRVRVGGVDDRTVTLERVSAEFAEAVQSGARGPGRRAAVPAGGIELATARYFRG